jgi:hypothetical protein
MLEPELEAAEPAIADRQPETLLAVGLLFSKPRRMGAGLSADRAEHRRSLDAAAHSATLF